MKYSEKWGDSIESAVELALQELKLTKDQVTVTVLEEPSKGFFGIGSKLAKVRVEEIVKEKEKKEEAPRKEAPKKEQKETENVKEEKTAEAAAAPEKKKNNNLHFLLPIIVLNIADPT